MHAVALTRGIARVPAPVLAVLLILLAAVTVAVTAFAMARGVPVAHHLGMSFDGKPKMSFD